MESAPIRKASTLVLWRNKKTGPRFSSFNATVNLALWAMLTSFLVDDLTTKTNWLPKKLPHRIRTAAPNAHP